MTSPASLVPPYVSAQPIARWLAALLVATGLAAWIAVGFDLADIQLLGREADGESIESLDKRAHGLTAVVLFTVQTVLLAGTVFFFMLWTYAARSNLRALGARRLDYRTAWSVTGWWIPGLNFVRPYQVLREIWKASDPAIADRFEWKLAPTPRILVLWWITFVGFLSFEIVSLAMSMGASGVLVKFQLARVTSILADTCGAISASLAWFVVTKITDSQVEKWELRDRHETIDDDLLAQPVERESP